MPVELPEKGTRIHVEALAQFRCREAGRGLAHQSHDRIGQVAMPGETDITMEPQAEFVELGVARARCSSGCCG